jgi:molybdenum cofactor cytidylyltransferase
LKVAGIVLAAGASTRMGQNKMRLQVGNESLVHRAVRVALESGLHPVVVVLGFEADATAAELAAHPVQTVINPQFAGPSSTSLHTGLHALTPDIDAVVVLLGDMPHVTAEMVRSLLRAAASYPAPLVVSRYGDVTAPPLLFRRQLFPELLAWTGEGCGKAVVRAHRGEAVYLDWPPPLLADVDTPADYETVVRTLG